MNQSSGDNSVDPSGTSSSSAPSPRSRAAKRLSGWSLNLLASALVILIAITFGRTLIGWWQQEPDETLDPASAARELGLTGRGNLEGPWSFEFGNSPLTFIRHDFAGKREAAIEALVDSCAEVAKRGTGRIETIGPSEKRMLERLRGQQPFAGDRGIWQVYHLDGPLPMVVGVRESAAKTPPNGRNIDEPERRVVCWGIAIQQAELSWTLLTAAPKDAASPPDLRLPEIPVPPGARKTVSLRGADGSALIGFNGNGGISEWSQFFADWFRQQGWKSQDGWNRVGSGMHARFRGADGLQCDVQIRADENGLAGLMTVFQRED